MASLQIKTKSLCFLKPTNLVVNLPWLDLAGRRKAQAKLLTRLTLILKGICVAKTLNGEGVQRHSIGRLDSNRLVCHCNKLSNPDPCQSFTHLQGSHVTRNPQRGTTWSNTEGYNQHLAIKSLGLTCH